MSSLELKDIIQAIEDEPELPGDPPEKLRLALRVIMERKDMDALIELLRITTRITKQSIRDRIESLIGASGGGPEDESR